MKQLRKDRGSFRTEASAPTQGRGDVGQDRLDDMGIIVDAELVRNRQQQRVGFGDRLVGAELLDQPVGLVGIAAAEDGAHIVDHPDLVLAAITPEIGAVAIVDEDDSPLSQRIVSAFYPPQFITPQVISMAEVDPANAKVYAANAEA